MMMNYMNFNDMEYTSDRKPFLIIAKPVGPVCNLVCRYCFYLEKKNVFPEVTSFHMPDDVLEEFIRQYIGSQDSLEIMFSWQGGEPLCAGKEFFKRAITLQEKYAYGKRISNSIQTNGTLLDDEWCDLFAAHGVLAGVSLDGPEDLHDHYRKDSRGNGSFDRVMRGISLLRKHGVDFNTLSVVSDNNVSHPIRVYDFLKDAGSFFHQYIPLVERKPSATAQVMGLNLDIPPERDAEFRTEVTPWSVSALEYGDFLISIFDEWARNDVGSVFVQPFDNALEAWFGGEASLCVFRKTCGDSMVIEHDGSVYSCDHYVYPRYRLGNIMEGSLEDLARSKRQLRFGNAKHSTLPETCLECDVRFACNGGCLKHRFGINRLNYLCEGYKCFFNHVKPYMEKMCDLLAQERSPALIMDMVRCGEAGRGKGKTGRNDPCPCGSGLKYKRCCGQRSG